MIDENMQIEIEETSIQEMSSLSADSHKKNTDRPMKPSQS